MQNDKTTLKDLSVFTAESAGGIFGLIDFTTTKEGKDALRKHILYPPETFEQLAAIQEVIKFWAANPQLWPSVISNGTLVMLDKFFEAADTVSSPPGTISLLFGNFFQKLLNKNEYFFTQFSLSHLSDFLKGCTELTGILSQENVPHYLRTELEAMQEDLSHRLAGELIKLDKDTPFRELAALSFKARREMKNNILRLIERYARLDCWHSMGRATISNNWVFPELSPSKLLFEAKGLYHPLLKLPVAYDISFTEHKNFLLLTGANMSGKTTFMRSLGVAGLLAHLGMGVPAGFLRISFLEGIITNMQVEDDILRGESYFFAEVQRMKLTAQKLQESGPRLVLMDELFKGTNVHDAYECTRAVVEGLLHRPNHIMILSTHLYEVARHFKGREDIIFNYFITEMDNENNYLFTYQLNEGISNDRIGYRILQKEGVLDLLKKS